MYDFSGFVPTTDPAVFATDRKLLVNIFRVKSPSGSTQDMGQFIQDFLTHYNIDFKVDDVGNIYRIDNPDLPLLSAHMDTVQKKSDLERIDFVDIEPRIVTKNILVSPYTEKKTMDVIINTNPDEKGGVIGADDKIGIYLILEMLRNHPEKKFNFVFSIDEEVGAVGANHFEGKNKIDHIPYALVLDRRNSGDIICVGNNYGTYEFQTAIHEIGKKFGYSPTTGSLSDANAWSKQISCCNLSVGYYNPHSESEYAILEEFENTYRYVCAIVEGLHGKKFNKPSARTYNYPSYQGRGYSGYGYYDKDGKWVPNSKKSYSTYDDYDEYGDGYWCGNRKNNKKKTSNPVNSSSFKTDLIYIKTLGVYIDYDTFEKLYKEVDAEYMKSFIGV